MAHATNRLQKAERWQILLLGGWRTFLSGSRASSHRRQVHCHLLIQVIDLYNQWSSIVKFCPLWHNLAICRAVTNWIEAEPAIVHKVCSAPPKKIRFLGDAVIGFRSRFSQCVDYMRFNEKTFCFRWQETTKLMLFGNTKTSSLVILCDLKYLTGNISSVMTKHMGVQRKLHRVAYLIVQIILLFYS